MYTNCLAKLDGLGMGGGSSCLVFVSVFVVAVFWGVGLKNYIVSVVFLLKMSGFFTRKCLL